MSMKFHGQTQHKAQLATNSAGRALTREEALRRELGLDLDEEEEEEEVSEEDSDADDGGVGLPKPSTVSMGDNMVEVDRDELTALGDRVKSERARRKQAEEELRIASELSCKANDRRDESKRWAHTQVNILKKSYTSQIEGQEREIEELRRTAEEYERVIDEYESTGKVEIKPRKDTGNVDLDKIAAENESLKAKLKQGLEINKQLRDKVEEMLPATEKLRALEEENESLQDRLDAKGNSSSRVPPGGGGEGTANSAENEELAATVAKLKEELNAEKAKNLSGTTTAAADQSASEEAFEEERKKYQRALEKRDGALAEAKERVEGLEKQLGDNTACGDDVARLQTQLTEERTKMDEVKKQVEVRFQQMKDEREKDSTKAAQQMDHYKKADAERGPLLKRTLATTRGLSTLYKQMAADVRTLSSAVVPTFAEFKPVVSLINAQTKDLAEKTRRYKKEVTERRRLFNEVQELKGNIRVFCRVRPLSKGEMKKGETDAASFPDDDNLVVTNQETGVAKSFDFERVFSPNMSQEQVFEDTEPLVTSVMDGYNVCIFAYGQTGSGKTHTMEGPASDRGVNCRALQGLFGICADREEDWEYSIRVSYVEIYIEEIRDLLADKQSEKKLEIRQGPNGNHVPDLNYVTVEGYEQVLDVMSWGTKNRSVGKTNMNEHSSRSHSLLCVEVTGGNKHTGLQVSGKLNLVDLAGSERVGRSEAQGQRLKEAQNINKSLSALGDVIQALGQKQNHVPFRNSKLTYLLQDSLGGDSKTLMFVNINPSSASVGESLCSLNFAHRVRSVELGKATKNTQSAEMVKMKQQLLKYESQLGNRR